MNPIRWKAGPPAGVRIREEHLAARAAIGSGKSCKIGDSCQRGIELVEWIAALEPMLNENGLRFEDDRPELCLSGSRNRDPGRAVSGYTPHLTPRTFGTRARLKEFFSYGTPRLLDWKSTAFASHQQRAENRAPPDPRADRQAHPLSEGCAWCWSG